MIVALCGRIASGKTTLVERLRDRYPNLIRRSFAEAVKRYAKELFGATISGPYKNRDILQKFAETMKTIDPDIWVNILKREVESYDENNLIVIDDLRFPNELAMLKQLNAYIVRLNISPAEQRRRIIACYDNADEHLSRLNHISESYVDNMDVDLELPENYDIALLAEKIMTR